MTILRGLISGLCVRARNLQRNCEPRKRLYRKSRFSTFPRFYVYLLTLGVCVPALAGTGNEPNISLRDQLIHQFQASDHPQKQHLAKRLSQGQGHFVERQGRVELFYEDYQNPATYRLRQVLITATSERIRLLAADNHPAFNTGDSIVVSGLEIEDESQPLTYLAYDPTAESTAVTSAAATAQTTGNQSTLILLVNFQDDNSQPFTTQQAADVIFNTASGFLYENAFGAISLSGNAYGWYTLPTTIAGCNSELLMDLADQAATAHGINPGNYQRVIYVHPRRTSCGWSGLASLGGSPSRVLLNGTLDAHNATHEIGHTLGLKHAHALECGAVSWSSSCINREYGDSLDNMGARFAHYDGFHKEQLGWLPASSFVTAGSSGTYELEPYAAVPGSRAKVLKVLRYIDPVTGNRQWFYIEYRQAIGYDNIIVEEYGYDQANILNGVIVRTGEENNTNSSNMLDMTPDSDSVWDFFDAALEVGSSYTDPLSGITLTTQYADAGRVQVYVQLSGSTASCTTANPQVDLSPMAGTSAAPGSSLQYRFTITNRDSSECSAATFNLTGSVPSGWGKSFSSTSLNLNPGASGSATLTVTSSTTAGDGAYIIQASAQQTTSGKLASDTATYTVSAPAPDPDPTNNAPIAVNDSANTVEKTAVTIPVLNNDSDPDGDALSVISVTQPNKGSVSIGAGGTLHYSPPRKFTGLVTFSYSISDGDKQATALVVVTVEEDTSIGGNGNGGGKSNGKGGGKFK